MKKIFSALGFCTIFTGILCGCAGKNKTSSVIPDSTLDSSPEMQTESIVEIPTVPQRIVETAEGTYVYDKAQLLSSEDFKACNDYAGWLYNEYLINAAVVTASDLGGKSPYDYAAEAYNEIYQGRGSGLLLLINNDTNNDLLYKTGCCLASIKQTDENTAFFWATRELINGDYKSAILRLMQLGESCSSFIIDNAEVFSEEQLSELSGLLALSSTKVTLLASSNSSATPNTEILKSYYDRKYKDGQGIMLMLDTKSKTIMAGVNEELPEELASALKEANLLAAKSDYVGAVKKAAKGLGITVPETAAR